MIIQLNIQQGINADSITINGRTYNYGYNCSYNREMAEIAHKDTLNAKKYNWDNDYCEKPFIGDILNKECGDAWLDSSNWAGYNTFKGNELTQKEIEDFIKSIEKEL